MRGIRRLESVLASELDDERPLLLATIDHDGDVIVRDLQRPGCLTHGETFDEAMRNLDEIRRLWDEDEADQRRGE